MTSCGEVRLALTTVAGREEARRLAEALVEQGAAACVNIVPAVESVYRWKGAMERASELLLVIKTTQDRLEALAAALSAMHSYELPELLVLDVEAGSRAYLDWVRSTSRGTSINS